MCIMPRYAPASRSSRQAAHLRYEWEREHVSTHDAISARRSCLYTRGRIWFTLPRLQLGQQARQLDEVLRAEVGAPARDDQERIGSVNVRPAGWQRAHPSLTRLAEEHAVLTPGMRKANQVVLVPAQWMEWVRHTESLRIPATAGS